MPVLLSGYTNVNLTDPNPVQVLADQYVVNLYGGTVNLLRDIDVFESSKFER